MGLPDPGRAGTPRVYRSVRERVLLFCGQNPPGRERDGGGSEPRWMRAPRRGCLPAARSGGRLGGNTPILYRDVTAAGRALASVTARSISRARYRCTQSMSKIVSVSALGWTGTTSLCRDATPDKVHIEKQRARLLCVRHISPRFGQESQSVTPPEHHRRVGALKDTAGRH